jgi:CRISPR-associated protein Csx3
MDGTGPDDATRFATAAGFAATRLTSASGIQAEFTEDGALFALRCGSTLINQFLPGPSEDGFHRLLLRWRSEGSYAWARLTGAGVPHRRRGRRAMEWTSTPRVGWTCRATLALHPRRQAWAWNILVQSSGGPAADVDVVLAQDLGLGDASAVRNNEAFTSQYIDLMPVEDPHLGWTVLARQNLPMSGAHPWLGSACEGGASAFCTDASQFFGTDHRISRVPWAVRSPSLCSERLQYESALAGLQSRPATLAPGGSAAFTFVTRYLPDHPKASAAGDLALLREVMPTGWSRRSALPRKGAHAPPVSLFVSAPWIHGDRPTPADWAAWYPGVRRHEEHGSGQHLLSFFCGTDTHVVSREKEELVARPHGHILRSGDWRWIDPGQFGTTCYAAGIFSAQAYLGNPTFARLLPVIRDALGVGRAAGQRVFVHRAGTWHQLGVPSAFSMTPGDARWIYRLGRETIQARVWCSRTLPAAFLELRMDSGNEPAEFLVTHTLALAASEFEHSGEIIFHREAGWASCIPDPASVVGTSLPGACFAIAAAEAGSASVTGDATLYDNAESRDAPCVILRSRQPGRSGIILCGSPHGRLALRATVEAARLEWKEGEAPSSPPLAPVRLRLGASRPSQAVAVSRIDEILPWFVHNAAIHFSAPHGLEQYGGAAWGVRDVCQGSVEWLLASGEGAMARRALETVFAQQYARDGSWPQWFMHAPYASCQQVESHGDVCFWPVKALCDYAEVSDDLAFFSWTTGYTDPGDFSRGGPQESLLRHCDRVIDLCERRFVAGTALVNYGEGDWDDTLQPADPSMRTRMVSSWTVALAFHTFRQLSAVCHRLGETARAGRLEDLLARMRRDFAEILMPQGVVAGFLVNEPDGTKRPLIHPADTRTGIRYRLLPMTRAVLAELFTREEAARHMEIVHRELLYPDGVRLMSEPAAYIGGRENLFKRADTAANVGREIGLQYVHAHLRYAEAMAKLGEADRLWTALQVANPVALAEVVGNAMPRQSNVYFTSSDADFNDRYEAARRWTDLKSGSVGVRGGWRLYSSGPGMFVHKVRSCLLGLRESFGDIVFDPVLPPGLDGLIAHASLCGNPVEVRFSVKHGSFATRRVSLNGVELQGGRREKNPYREGGLTFIGDNVRSLLSPAANILDVEL